MAGKWHDRRCSNCGKGTLHDGSRLKTNEYRGNPFSATYTGAYCDHCDDGMAYDDAKIDAAWEKFCREVDEREREELTQIRARLKLTQDEASRISGGGHNAFSRYERGEAKPVIAVMNLFRLLDRHPELIREVARNLAAKASQDQVTERRLDDAASSTDLRITAHRPYVSTVVSSHSVDFEYEGFCAANETDCGTSAASVAGAAEAA
jgi:HTH-type transcriptional regulator / antitoxin MqsA